MHHLIAYYEAQDGGGALHNVAAIADQSLTVSGDDVRIPASMPYVIGKAVLSGADSALTSARLNTPSLRTFAYPEIEPLVNALVFGSPPEGILHPNSPIPLVGDESMRLEINSDADSALGEYGLVWLADGPQSEVSGDIHPVSATAAASLAAGTWVNSALTFSQTLPVGTYQVVGMRARGTNLVAARLVFLDQQSRPGVPAVNAIGDQDHDLTRYGKMGIFGTFNHTNPPTVDCLGVTDSSQTIILDLMKIA